jgi:hypothetical protein
MRIFDFTEDDLEANRAGRISERQIIRLTKENENTVGCSIVVILGFAIFGAIAFFAKLSPQTGRDSNPNTVLLIFGAGAIMVLLIAFLAYTKTQSDINNRIVTSIEGEIKLRMIPMKTGFMYLIQIGGKEFVISDYAYSVLNSDYQSDLEYMPFRLYFASDSRKILSVILLKTPVS